jgi:hypothetical protein
MRLLVTGVVSESRRVVRFTSPDGEGIARWEGDLPAVGEECDAELEVAEPIAWHDIQPVGYPVGIAVDPEDPMCAVIIGVVMDYGSEHVLNLSLRESVLLVDTVGDAPGDMMGARVALLTRHLRIHPDPHP